MIPKQTLWRAQIARSLPTDQVSANIFFPDSTCSKLIITWICNLQDRPTSSQTRDISTRFSLSFAIDIEYHKMYSVDDLKFKLLTGLLFLQHFVLVPQVHALVQSVDSALHGHFLVEHVELQLHLTTPLSFALMAESIKSSTDKSWSSISYILFGRLLKLIEFEW